MAFFVMLFLFFVFMRFSRVHRMRRWQRGYMYGWHPQRQLCHLRYAGQSAPTHRSEPRESAFERLKRRYVKGEISDYQYESELDELLKTPEGRREI